MLTIVGAGLVGSLWARLLKQKGYEVQVFEKRADPRAQKTEAGRSINLVITSRGLYGLECAGLLNRVQDITVPVFGRMIHPKQGELAYQAYGQEDECNLSISRADLNRFLIQEAESGGVRFYFEHELEHLDPKKKELQFKTPSGMTTHSYEVLFGTDGAGSRVRKEMARFLPEMKDQTDWLEADYKELYMPLGSDGKPQLQKNALHIWPRGAHMMMALANRDGSFTMTVYLPKTGSAWSFDKTKDAAGIRKLFQEEFADAIPMMPHYEEEFMEHPQGTLGTVRCSQWVYQDSIALMGDAAHAIVPFFGQGMNCAFEDATCLLKWMDQHQGRWDEILKAYQAERKPNADAIADMALENWVEMRDSVGDPRFLLRKKIENLLEKNYPGVYKSRYGLITYTLVPYALAQKTGLKQAEILDELTKGIQSPEELSQEKMDQVIKSHWFPFVKENNLKIENYLPLKNLIQK